MANRIEQARLVTTQLAIEASQGVTELALFDADGNPVSLAPLAPASVAARGTVKQAAAQADTTAVDLAALKVDFNALLAKLRTAGLVAPNA